MTAEGIRVDFIIEMRRLRKSDNQYTQWKQVGVNINSISEAREEQQVYISTDQATPGETVRIVKRTHEVVK